MMMLGLSLLVVVMFIPLFLAYCLYCLYLLTCWLVSRPKTSNP